MPTLSSELRQALKKHPGKPLTVEDDQSHLQYVIILREEFDQLQKHAAGNDTIPAVESYATFSAATQDNIDADGMEEYDALLPQSS